MNRHLLIDVTEDETEHDSLLTAYALHWHGHCVYELGRLAEAESLTKRELAIKQVELGPNEMTVARAYWSLCLCITQSGRLRDAVAFYKRGFEVTEAKFGLGDCSVADALDLLGECVFMAKRPAEAEALFRRAI